MSQLKAFVGHSFTSEDEEVVRAFLKFFDNIKGVVSGFSWEHAEPAEPKVLADKVLRLIKDKNLFIGICTNKEAAIEPDRLKRGVFQKKVLKGDKAQFSSKTSDWIIQEIGLAIGRGMDLILLVENGVRQPGGLQGNLEYIPFERNAPEKSFGKVLEMIKALLPKAKPLPVEEAIVQSAPKEKPELEKHETDEWLQPKSDWTRRHYEIALMHTIAFDNQQGAKMISDAYSVTKDGQIIANRESWEAYQEYILIRFGKGGNLTTLENLAKVHPENSEVQKYLAMSYREYEDHEKAAQFFKAAAESAKDNSRKLDMHGEEVISLVKTGHKKHTHAIIEKMKVLATQVENGEVLLIKTLLQVVEHEEDKDLLFGLTERLLTLSPNDVESRFFLAYNYSQKNQNELSLYHYLKIPYQVRMAGTWNNLGVAFDHFGLVYKSVKAYRKAEELGETLAMSNLAQKLIKAGFLVEAHEICKRAVKIEDYDKNVGYTVSRIKEIPEEEDKQEKEVVEKAAPLSEFYRNYGHSAVQEDIGDDIGCWRGPDCKLQITIKEGVFLAEGCYERQRLGLSLYETFLKSPGLGSPPKTTKYHLKYMGKVYGRTAKCTVMQQEENKLLASHSLLGEATNKKEVLMILSETLREIKVYEKGSTNDRTFYTLTRIE